MRVFLQRIGLLGGVGGFVPIWPHGPDALWDNVVFMVDWKEMAKRASPGDTVYDETGRHQFTIPANATLSESTGLTLTTGISIPDSEDWNFNGGVPFCIEAVGDLNPSATYFSQIDWGGYSNDAFFMIRVIGGNYSSGWAYGTSITSLSEKAYSAGLQHASLISNGGTGYSHYNGASNGSSGAIENINNSPLNIAISGGTFTMHRVTKGVSRYDPTGAYTPNTVFGKGSLIGYGSDPNWGDVNLQVNFANYTTAQLVDGFPDETGNHFLTFDAGAEIDAEGYLVNGNMHTETTDDGAFNNVAGTYVEGQTLVMLKRPSAFTGTVSRWGYGGGWRGWVQSDNGATFAKANNAGSHTGLQNKSQIPGDTLGLLAFQFSTDFNYFHYKWRTGAGSYDTNTSNRDKLPLGQTEYMTFAAYGAARVRAFRCQRGSRNATGSALLNMVLAGGLPGA